MIVEKERKRQWKEPLDKTLDEGVRLWAYSRHVASEVKKTKVISSIWNNRSKLLEANGYTKHCQACQ